MRLGNYPAHLKEGSLAHRIYGVDEIVERHRHRYEVNPAYIAVHAGALLASVWGSGPTRSRYRATAAGAASHASEASTIFAPA